MAALCPLLHIEWHHSGPSCLEEIAQDLQPGRGVQFLSLRGQLPEACCDLAPHALKICPRLINASFVGTDRKIPLLHHIVVAGRVGTQHIIVLLAVTIQLVCLRPDQQLLFKLPAVYTAVVDGNLCTCTRIQHIEQFRIIQQLLFVQTQRDHMFALSHRSSPLPLLFCRSGARAGYSYRTGTSFSRSLSQLGTNAAYIFSFSAVPPLS